MNEDEKKAGQNLTEDERKKMEETGETAPEAHREGELEELKALIADLAEEVSEGFKSLGADLAEEVSEGFKSLGAALSSLRGIALDNGAGLDGEEDGDGEDEERFGIPDYDEMDFNL